MKRILVVVAVLVATLGGCVVVPWGDHDRGYHREHRHHDYGDRYYRR